MATLLPDPLKTIRRIAQEGDYTDEGVTPLPRHAGAGR
jgi:hypothetical protein